MKLFKIEWKILPVLAALSAMGWASSCNNSDDEVNNSTAGTDTAKSSTTPDVIVGSTPDPSVGTNTATTTNSGKKMGKVSVAMSSENKADKMAADKTGYYNYTEVSPAFSGGQSAIESYINNNIEYPQQAIDNNVEGTVRVQFGIDENGKISNVKAIGSKIGYGLEDEAIRVIASMPKWNPGQVKGKNVKTWMILPVTYQIES
jgi:protein TonB